MGRTASYDDDRKPVSPAGTKRIPPLDPRSIFLRRRVERCFLEWRDPVFRYLRSLGCDSPLAEEITQEAFLRLHRSLDDGLEVNDPGPWLLRVARNLWIDTRRGLHRQSAGWDEGAQPNLTLGGTPLNPEESLLRRERIRRLDREILRLPDLQRECLRLKARGLRYHEIADALDISMSVAVDSVRRAVRQLRKLFHE